MSESTPLPPLLAVGFFRELPGERDDGDESIREALGRGDAAHKQQLLVYLRSAPVLVTYFMQVDDVLDEMHAGLGPLALHTDGTWVWRSDLAHYVDTYDVALPDAFIAHASSRSWTPPTDDEIDASAWMGTSVEP